MVVRPSKGGAFGHVVRLGRGARRRAATRSRSAARTAPAARDSASRSSSSRSTARRPAPPTRRGARRWPRLRSFRPDLVHAHGSQGGAVARLARYARPADPGRLLAPQLRLYQLLREPRRSDGAYRAIEIALAPLATRVHLRLRGGAAPGARASGSGARARVVYNGIDPLPSRPRSGARGARPRGPADRRGHRVPAAEGRADADRGDAAVLAPHPEAQPAVAGDGPMRPEIEAQIAALGLGRRGPPARPDPGRRGAARRRGRVRLAGLVGVVPVRDPRGDGRRRCRSSPPTSAASARRSRTGSPAGWWRRARRRCARRGDRRPARRPRARARSARPRASGCSSASPSTGMVAGRSPSTARSRCR